MQQVKTLLIICTLPLLFSCSDSEPYGFSYFVECTDSTANKKIIENVTEDDALDVRISICVDLDTQIQLSGISNITVEIIEPSEESLALYKKLKSKPHPSGITMNKPKPVPYIKIQLSKDETQEFSKWTEINNGKSVVVLINNKILSYIHMNKVNEDGIIEIPISAGDALAKKYASMISKSRKKM